ncbi:hypothetical protein NBO_1060g0001 [Nosema bombycis CQ1]|uniref:Uncharacterized protein n=1 Tax=Nosema bombycis (strain CQ1 / CVCC 102059) TaxID=578461 RepID=R0M0K8_NOSB1|nr:hypothetical protein NBO_1060g0001 [Nosema bombycis CQ1]|eukprot:EOB11559.1 hypothetical protein NBO_1060g0001 [Nosema bombycis CQ1]
MTLSHCLHLNLDQNGFCVLCGFEIHSTIQLTNDLLNLNLPLPSISSKYKPIHIKKLTELDLITDYLNIKEYKPLILNELQSKSFSSRLSFKDKSLLCIYHILKEDSYPILFCDLQKFTKRKLTCDYFKEFGNRNLKEEYLKNVYKRFKECGNNEENVDFESYKEMIKKNLNKKIEVISKKYFLKEGNGICSEKKLKCGENDRSVKCGKERGAKKNVKERLKEIKKILDA